MSFVVHFPAEPTQEIIDFVAQHGGTIFTENPTQVTPTPRRSRRFTNAQTKIGSAKRALNQPYTELVQRDPTGAWRPLFFLVRDLDAVSVAREIPGNQFRLASLPFDQFTKLVNGMGNSTLLTTMVNKLLLAEGVQYETVQGLEEICSRLNINPSTLPHSSYSKEP